MAKPYLALLLLLVAFALFVLGVEVVDSPNLPRQRVRTGALVCGRIRQVSCLRLLMYVDLPCPRHVALKPFLSTPWSRSRASIAASRSTHTQSAPSH